MSYPDRNNPYSFNAFLDWRENCDYYADDPFARKVLRAFCGDMANETDAAARDISGKASFRWRRMTEAITRPEKRPVILHFDGHRNRIDRIVRPHEIEVMEQEVFAEGLFSDRTHPWIKLAKMFVIYQNGESCIACPLTCTEGLVAVLEPYADTSELQRILKHCKEGLDGCFGIGAQYISEIQSGSDIPANLLEAVPENDGWRLYGTKFFCSATHADYALVTAKPRGSDRVGLFVVPSWLPGDKERERRNGFTIDRIKWKMGTSELTTGEITFNGARAYQVGPLDRGLANVVGIVLTYSRLTVGLWGASSMMRAWREAAKYCEFRAAFGAPIGRFALVAGQLAKIERIAKRTLAGAFRLYKDVLALPGGFADTGRTDEIGAVKKKRFDVRELIMLQKITTAWDTPVLLRSAISLFGGHGVMEDFSSLPRLYRDAAVNELWEGPRNVLLTQILRDLQKAATWYSPAEFVHNVLAGADTSLVQALGHEIEQIVAYPNLGDISDETIAVYEQWDGFCHRLFHAYQDVALEMVVQNE